jgi:hypothetical protein
MMVWGFEGPPIKLIYGLQHTGGSSDKNGNMTYRVYNQNNSFNKELSKKDYDNIKKIYEKFVQENPTIVPKEHQSLLRKKKLKIIGKN